MPLHTISDTEFVTLHFNTETRLLHLTWKPKAPNYDEYKEIYTTCLEFQKSTGIRYFLSDTRKQSSIPTEYREWFENTVLPRAEQQGLSKGAILIEGNVLKLHYLNNILKKTQKLGIPFKAFKTEDVAIQWLLSNERSV